MSRGRNIRITCAAAFAATVATVAAAAVAATVAMVKIKTNFGF